MFQILAGLLFQAAREGSYVDPAKVQEFLGVPDEETGSNDIEDATKNKQPSGMYIEILTMFDNWVFSSICMVG